MTVQTASRFSVATGFAKRTKIGVVDPSSGGYFIAQRALDRGFDCVAISSSSGSKPSHIDFTACLHVADHGFHAELLHQNCDAVIPGAESGVSLCETLARNLGVKGNDPRTTHWRRNKTAMAKAVRAAGISLYRQARCSSTADSLAWANSIGFPVVVKPEASSGSDLVKVCQTPDEVVTHARLILSGVDKIARTIDLATCPALVELAHEDPNVVEADILMIRELEKSGRMLEVK